MINLKTNCEECIHVKICKNKNNAKNFCERLSDLTYGSGPNDDYDWNTMSDHYNVNIDISCPDFKKTDRPILREKNVRRK